MPVPMLPSTSHHSAPAHQQTHQVRFNPSTTGATGAPTAIESSKPVVLHKPRPAVHRPSQSQLQVPQMRLPGPSASQPPEPLNPLFQYSRCNRGKRALCVCFIRSLLFLCPPSHPHLLLHFSLVSFIRLVAVNLFLYISFALLLLYRVLTCSSP